LPEQVDQRFPARHVDVLGAVHGDVFVRMHAADAAFDDHEALAIILAGWMHRHDGGLHLQRALGNGHRSNVRRHDGSESAQCELVAHVHVAHRLLGGRHRVTAGCPRDRLDLCGLRG